MPHACKISEVIELLQQHQHDDFVLCSLWYCQQQSNFDPPLFNNSSCNLTHLFTQD